MNALAITPLCVGFHGRTCFKAHWQAVLQRPEQKWINIVSEPDHSSFDILGGDAAGQAGTQKQARDIGKLEDIGFDEGKVISSIVDSWLNGDFVKGEGSDKRLSELAPGLLTEFAATQNPDQAIANFDVLLGHLAEDQKPFERLGSDQKLADCVVDMFGNATRFGEILVKTPDLVEQIFSSDGELPQDAEGWLAAYPAPGRHGSTDQVLGAVSDWLWENRARLCLANIRDGLDLETTGEILAALSDVAVEMVYQVALTEANPPKRKTGKGLAVIAMGDYGCGNLAVDAPVDLVFVYDPDGEKGASAKAVKYYTDVAQVMTELLTQPRAVTGSASLPLFQVDTRCRPGGMSGEIASSVRGYQNYFVGEADARDQLTLTTARVVAGPDVLKGRLDEIHTEFLTRPRQADRVMRDIDKARTKDFRMHAPSSVWDIDRIRGGYTDLKIIVQCLQANYGGDHPYVLSTDMQEALNALGRAGCVDSPLAAELIESLAFWRRLKAVMAFTDAGDPGTTRPRTRLAKLLAKAAGVSDYSAVEPLIRGHAERTLAHYNHLVLGASPDATSSGQVA